MIFWRKQVNGPKSRGVVAVVVAVMLLAVVSPAVSGPDGTEAIKERHEAMEAIGNSIGALAAIAKKEAPFDAAVVKENAEKIADLLQESASLFPEGSDKGDAETWAKAEIWSDPDGFKKALKQCHTAAVEMASVTDPAEFGPALGKLGNGCKTCHDKYRRPKE
jgi:cytochrome c556